MPREISFVQELPALLPRPEHERLRLDGQGATRKRASRACISCRTRKVRCDVERQGQPCTNCNIDCVECVVKPRTRRSHLSAAAARRERVSNKNKTCSPSDLTTSPEEQAPADQSTPVLATPQTLNEATTLDDDLFVQSLIEWKESPVIAPDEPTPSALDFFLDWPLDVSQPTTEQNDQATNALEPFTYPTPSIVSEPPLADQGPYISFSAYPSVRAGGLDKLGRQDLSFLEDKGCLVLPRKLVLDHFLQQYFLRVHPILPILSESNICSALFTYSACSSLQDPIPLVLLQAILFLAAPYVTPSKLATLGLSSVHDAQMHFYAKTKTLYDIDQSQDDLTRAQVALMLTYYVPTANDKTNSYWMTVAIHHAKSAQANRFDRLISGPCRQRSDRKAAILKRLWWCCILRDRIMSLGLRRPLCIHPADIDPLLPHLTEDDFADEILQHWVNSKTTKEMQVRLSISICHLGMILGDILEAVYPLTPRSTECSRLRSQSQIARVATKLDQWYAKMALDFKDPKCMARVHESLYILLNMSYIYYHTARIAFYNHIMLLSVTETEDSNTAVVSTKDMQVELNKSLRHITDDFTGLEACGLVKFLPNTFIYLSFLPFIWHIIFAKFVDTTRQTSSGNDLRIYVAVMRTFRCLYGSADSALKSIEDIIKHVKANESKQLYSHDQGRVSAVVGVQAMTQVPGKIGVNLFGVKPHSYLRISLTVDYSLSCGQLLSEQDFPKALHESRGPEHDGPSEVRDVEFYEYLQRAFDIGIPA